MEAIHQLFIISTLLADVRYNLCVLWSVLQVRRCKQSVLDGRADVRHAGEGVGSLGRLSREPLHQGTVGPPPPR